MEGLWFLVAAKVSRLCTKSYSWTGASDAISGSGKSPANQTFSKSEVSKKREEKIAFILLSLIIHFIIPVL